MGVHRGLHLGVGLEARPGCGRRSRDPASSAPAARGARTRAPALGLQLRRQLGLQGHQQLAVALGRRALALDQPHLDLLGREIGGAVRELDGDLPRRLELGGQGVAVRRVERLLDLGHPLAEARAGLREDRLDLVMDVDRAVGGPADLLDVQLVAEDRRGRARPAPASPRPPSPASPPASGCRVFRPCRLRAAWPRPTIRCTAAIPFSSGSSRRSARRLRPRLQVDALGGVVPLAADQMAMEHLGDEGRERRDQPRERGEHLVERLVGARLVGRGVLAAFERPEPRAAAADVPVGQVVQELLDRPRAPRVRS